MFARCARDLSYVLFGFSDASTIYAHPTTCHQHMHMRTHTHRTLIVFSESLYHGNDRRARSANSAPRNCVAIRFTRNTLQSLLMAWYSSMVTSSRGANDSGAGCTCTTISARRFIQIVIRHLFHRPPCLCISSKRVYKLVYRAHARHRGRRGLALEFVCR